MMLTTATRSFGDTLAGFRAARKLSQSRLADRADVDHSYISRIETGARLPSRDMVQRFCEALELDAVEIVTLHHAAGFVPGRPEMGRLIEQGKRKRDREMRTLEALLDDPTVPRPIRQTMRDRVRFMIEFATAAREGAVS